MTVSDLADQLRAYYEGHNDRPSQPANLCKRAADRIAQLESALSACHIECQHLSHRKGEYHGFDVECPVEKRINALLTPANQGGKQ